MSKESVPEKLIPTRRNPKRSEHFAPLEETVPSRDLNPEERLIAEEQGILEEPGTAPATPKEGAAFKPELPEGVSVSADTGGTHVHRRPPSANKTLGIPKEKHREDWFAPSGGSHRKGSRIVAHESHGKHGQKPERPKGSEFVRES